MPKHAYLNITHSGKKPTLDQVKKYYKKVYELQIQGPIPKKIHPSICNTIFANFQHTDLPHYMPFHNLKIRSMMIGDIIKIDYSMYMCGDGADWNLIT